MKLPITQQSNEPTSLFIHLSIYPSVHPSSKQLINQSVNHMSSKGPAEQSVLSATTAAVTAASAVKLCQSPFQSESKLLTMQAARKRPALTDLLSHAWLQSATQPTAQLASGAAPATTSSSSSLPSQPVHERKSANSLATAQLTGLSQVTPRGPSGAASNSPAALPLQPAASPFYESGPTTPGGALADHATALTFGKLASTADWNSTDAGGCDATGGFTDSRTFNQTLVPVVFKNVHSLNATACIWSRLLPP